jgi:hypothetical protein
MKQRIYLDTSVFGGVFDENFAHASKILFENIQKGLFELVTSAVVREEISIAPPQVITLFEEFVDYADIIEISKEALELRDAYLREKIVTLKYSDDALHVALATISKSSIIISWNFKHIVHYDKIPLYNAVNILHGYRQISIHSPSEVIVYE